MDEKRAISDAAFWCIKYYGICLLLALMLYVFTRKAEDKGYEAGFQYGKRMRRRYDDEAALRKQAADIVEKVEREANG